MTTREALKERHLPFSSLRYTTEAFIDYCIPESNPKFNYALIGPGVAQNPRQPVSLREPHGFQLGAVSMPHGKVNPAHMHFTCEVFICTRGDWRIQWGFNPEAASADIGAGDLVSVPTWIYRGFTNIGVDDGFMFAVLGGDSTGGILWGPSAIAAASRNGVHLTEDHRMIDSGRGETLEPGTRLFEPMSQTEIAALRNWSPAEMAQRIVRFKDLAWSRDGLLDSALPGCGAEVAAAVGFGITQDREMRVPVVNPHGVSIEWLKIPAGGTVSRHRLAEKQVIIARQGAIELAIEAQDGTARFGLEGGSAGWDTFSIPPDCWRSLSNTGPQDALALLITAGDHRKSITWDDAVIAAAARQGRALDADRFVAPRRFVERAQR